MLNTLFILHESLNKKDFASHLIYKHPCNITEKVLQVKLLELRKRKKNKIFSNLCTELSAWDKLLISL